MILTAKTQEAFRNHVLEVYPEEACGLVVGGRYIKCDNVAENKLTNFKIDPLKIIKYSGKIQAVLHSHPYKLGAPQKWDPVWPTTADMRNWMQDSIPWGIVSTDGEGISQFVWMDDSTWEPLEGREFIHGVHDCYSIVRDYFREKGITLPNYARGVEWWDKGQDLYSENFQKAGFVEIKKEEATVGDCCLFQVRSPVINHAAVITGEDEIIHHMFHRLSHKDSMARWERQIVKYVRYQGPQGEQE